MCENFTCVLFPVPLSSIFSIQGSGENFLFSSFYFDFFPGVSSVLYASQDLTVSSYDSCRMLLLFKFNYKTLEEALFCLFLNRPNQCNSLSPDSIHKF